MQIPLDENVVDTEEIVGETPEAPPISKEEAANIIDKYIAGEPIEKEFTIGGKITVVVSFPNIEIANEIYRTVSKASMDGYVNMQVESSSRMIAAYIKIFNGRNFEKELGDEYPTSEGKDKIRKILDTMLIEPVRDILTEKIMGFYDGVKYAFSDEILNFS